MKSLYFVENLLRTESIVEGVNGSDHSENIVECFFSMAVEILKKCIKLKQYFSMDRVKTNCNIELNSTPITTWGTLMVSPALHAPLEANNF